MITMFIAVAATLVLALQVCAQATSPIVGADSENNLVLRTAGRAVVKINDVEILSELSSQRSTIDEQAICCSDQSATISQLTSTINVQDSSIEGLRAEISQLYGYLANHFPPTLAPTSNPSKNPTGNPTTFYPTNAPSQAPTVPSQSGQSVYDSTGSHTWIAPAGVTSISVVCVGAGGAGTYNGGGNQGGAGGGLGWKNNITVVPGRPYNVVIGRGGIPPQNNQLASVTNGGDSNFAGIVQGGGGASAYRSQVAEGGGYIGDGGGNGGDGPIANTGGGGGAGGYTGNGGLGGCIRGPGCQSVQDGAPGSGGGGGGGHSDNPIGGGAGGGGGVGLYGQGTSGGASSQSQRGGQGGSGGQDGTAVSDYVGGAGGSYGGGGSGTHHGGAGTSGRGGDGACRIIWPGNSRRFPTTRTADE